MHRHRILKVCSPIQCREYNPIATKLETAVLPDGLPLVHFFAVQIAILVRTSIVRSALKIVI